MDSRGQSAVCRIADKGLSRKKEARGSFFPDRVGSKAPIHIKRGIKDPTDPMSEEMSEERRRDCVEKDTQRKRAGEYAAENAKRKSDPDTH